MTTELRDTCRREPVLESGSVRSPSDHLEYSCLSREFLFGEVRTTDNGANPSTYPVAWVRSDHGPINADKTREKCPLAYGTVLF